MEIERARAARAERAGARARCDELRGHGAQQAERERELAGLHAELAEQAPLAQLGDGVEPRIARFRAAQEARDAVRQEIHGQRRALLADRSSLRAVGARHQLPFWLGLASAALGGGLALLGERLGAALLPLGIALAALALGKLRGSRRKLGRIEAVLAAQRVRERTAEQRFESETEPLRAALAGLELSGVDALRSAVDAHQALQKRAADLEAALAAARSEQAGAAKELERLEKLLAGPDPGERLEQLEQRAAELQRVRAARELAPAPGPAAEPDQLVACAARGTGVDSGELRGRLAAALPLYLSALCARDLTHARYRAADGWLLRGPAQRNVRFAELPPTLAARVSLAFQLALIERTASERGAPFLIGPDLPALDPEETRTLGRALRRLSGSVQVIRVGPPDPAWAAHADLVARLS
jgi:hypothetical protein